MMRSGRKVLNYSRGFCHFVKIRIFILNQTCWTSCLNDLTSVQNQNIVSRDHCVETVSDGDHSAVSELSPQSLLNSSISVTIHSSSGLVQHQHFGSSQESSCKTYQLFLTQTEPCSSLRYLILESLLQVVDKLA